MWNSVQKLLHNDTEKALKSPPAIPLRRSALALSDLKTGSVVRFSIDCPLPPFTGKRATVIAQCDYEFGNDHVRSYGLDFGDGKRYTLTVAEDSAGHYLALSRRLNEAEQDTWFGRDALSFFTEKSSAKTIRCKIDLMEEGAWAAARYSKSVDWIEGKVTRSGARLHSVHYNLLVNESGEKALEIEHNDSANSNRVYVTVYRPVSDIAAIETAKVAASNGSDKMEPPLFREEAPAAAQPKARPDFRRITEAEGTTIHIPRAPMRPQLVNLEPVADEPELPSFLTAMQDEYLPHNEIISPPPERVRVGLLAARALIDRALSRNVRVRDVLRDMLGLDSADPEEVIFELPLSDSDYRALAMRFKLRPDHRDEIRARLQDELQKQLGPRH